MAGDRWLAAGGRVRLYRGHIVWLTREPGRGAWRYDVWRLASVRDRLVENDSEVRTAGPFDTEDQAYRDAVRRVEALAPTHDSMRRLAPALSRATRWLRRWVGRHRPVSAP